MHPRHAGLALLTGVLAGCSFAADEGGWDQQLAPAGPCYDFNLADGIDRGSTDELHSIFACINRQGTLDALTRFDAALDAPVRQGVAGLRVLDLGDALVEGADSGSLARALDALLAAGENPDELRAAARMGLELAYGVPVAELGTTVSINSSSALAAGVLVPLVDTAGGAATAVLDAELRPLPTLAAGLRSEEAPRLLWSVALLPEAEDDTLRAFATDWPALLADTLGEVQSPENDRNAGPTGNSLRDLLAVALAADALVAIGSASAPILESDYERGAIADWIVEEHETGRLGELDDGVLYLAAVDAAGNSLGTGDDSALVALLRLLRDGNQEVDCELEGIIFDWEWSLGNLSVAILEQLANLDPDTATAGVDILGNALGYPLTDVILDTVAESGVCPAIDAQLVADLQAIDRLSDPSTQALLRSLVGFLSATESYIPDVVNTAAAVHDRQLVEPLEELLRDLDHTELLDLVLATLPAIAEPTGRQASGFPAGIEPVNLDVVFDLVLAATDPENAEALSPLVNAVLAQPSTWTAASNLRNLLLAGPDTEVAQAVDWLRRALDADPEVAWRAAAADRVDDPMLTAPLLEVVESSTVRGALVDTELADEGAIPWLARLYVGGTLDVLLDTLALVQDLLGADDV